MNSKTNKRIKIFSLLVIALICVIFIVSCEKTPYEINDKDGFNVSVKYDANGGAFGTSTYITTDSYNISSLPLNGNGNKEIYLVPTDSESRDKVDRLTPRQAGYFFAGWFSKKTPVTNSKGEALDYYGEVASVSGRSVAYTYEGKWDFNKPLELDPNKSYSATNPVITLYAGWIPEFRIQFLDNSDKQTLLGEYFFNPSALGDLNFKLPAWNTETGTLDYFNFPTVENKTFKDAYVGETKVSTDTVLHSGTFNLDTAEYANETLIIYLDYKDGSWYKITKPSQLTDIWNPSGIYEIQNDLDFTDEAWPFVNNTFTGKIIGNGYTIKNVAIEQSGTSTQSFGLFGQLSGATLENVTFENVTALIAGGTRMPAATFGLLAGTIQGGTTLTEVKVTGSSLKIAQGINLGLATGYSFGLLCGLDLGDNLSRVDFDISFEVVPDEYAMNQLILTLGADGNSLALSFE